jgi:hypothetical protein
MALISSFNTTAGLNLPDVFNALTSSVQKLEDDIRTQIQKGGSGDQGTFSNQELIQLQQLANEWQIATNLETNILKSISDSMKGTVQNLH